MAGQHYYILPLTPDGFEMTFDFLMPLRFEITVEDIKNIIFSGYPVTFEEIGAPAQYGIISAEEAFQKVLVPNQQHGLMEIFRGNGGGGGGGSFYKLNLSGTPAPFPTPQPTFQPITSGGGGTVTQVVAEGDTLSAIAEHNGVSVEAIMQVNGLSDANIFVGQTLIIPIETAAEKVEGLRGMLSVVLYNQPDGSHRTEFGFSDPLHAYMLLEGDNLQEFENYQNRPVDIWGTILPNIDGILTVNVDRYEIPFPRLNFQILSGTDKEVNLESQSVMLFTGDDGQSYIELTPDCINPVGPDSVAGNGEVGQPILLEALIVPGVTYGGYPAACVSSKAMAIDPKSGQRVELLVTADQPYAMDEPSGVASSQPPTAAIEKIELAYYIRNPIYSITDSNAGADAQYLQPVWRFYGHYSNGDEFEILVQALKEEFLLPELAPNTPPG
ncbi:MAG: LysM peptidoglycan-binding domain-containing protein [Chloroflexi bacterium]|nr:LysM peptidoglycan-binding domain-containing protein [Chloroflexota bacterium]